MALMTAAANGGVATTRHLLAQEADVHTADARGVTPLIAAGADLHSLDSFNGTGLIRAADQ